MSGLLPRHEDDNESEDKRESHAELEQRFLNSVELRFPFGKRKVQEDGTPRFVVRMQGVYRSVAYVSAPPMKRGTESNQFVIYFFEENTAMGEMVPGIRCSDGLDVATPRSVLFLSRAEELAAEHGGGIRRNNEEPDPDDPSMLMQVVLFADSCSGTRRFDERAFRIAPGPEGRH